MTASNRSALQRQGREPAQDPAPCAAGLHPRDVLFFAQLQDPILGYSRPHLRGLRRPPARRSRPWGDGVVISGAGRAATATRSSSHSAGLESMWLLYCPAMPAACATASAPGPVIGFVGSTGPSSAASDFRLRQNGKFVNPASHQPARRRRAQGLLGRFRCRGKARTRPVKRHYYWGPC